MRVCHGQRVQLFAQASRSDTRDYLNLRPRPLFSRDLSGRKQRKMASLWRHSEFLWNVGDYQQSVKLRIDLASEAERIWLGESQAFVPSLYGGEFSSNLGHMGILAMHLRARSIGLLPEEESTLLVSRVGNSSVLKALENRFFILGPEEQFEVFGTLAKTVSEQKFPWVWPHLQKISLPKHVEGFSDYYTFHEVICRATPPRSWSTSPLLVSQQERDLLNRLLAKHGVSGAFVVLHVRAPNPSGHRNAASRNYIPATEELLKTGLGVVQIGKPASSLGIERPGFLDLTRLRDAQETILSALMHQAEFVITTQSGPGTIAMAIGTKTLTTNATSIGRNLLTGPPGSRSFPKIIEDSRGRRLTLGEVISHRIGFWEGVTTEPTEGLRHIENSPHEIKMACIEMLSDPVGEANREINRQSGWPALSDRLGAVGKGMLATHFLETHHDLVDYQ